MRYAVEIPGFEGHEIVIEVNVFSRPALIFDGAPVQRGARHGDYFLNRNDGKLVPVQLKPAAMGSSMKLTVEGSEYSMMEPLKWYQWVWIAIPMLLLFGGCIGGALGGAAIVINLRLFRSQSSAVARYVLSGMVSAACLTAFAIAALVFHLGFGGISKKTPAGKGPALTVETVKPSIKVEKPKTPGSPEMDQYLRSQIQAQDTVIDPDFLREVDAHAEKLADSQQHQSLKFQLGSRLCRDAARLQGEWVTQRLAGYVKTEPQLRNHAIGALIERNEIHALLPLMPDLDSEGCSMVLNHLAQKFSREKGIAVSALALVTSSLKDADPAVRERAFSLLCDYAMTQPNARSSLENAIRGEKDEKLRAPLEEKFLQGISRHQGEWSSQDCLTFARKGVSQKVVQLAVEKLSADSQNRQTHFDTLVATFPQVESAENRVWLLLAIKGFQLKDPAGLVSFYSRLLSDSDPAIRIAAVRAQLEILRQPGPETDRIEKLCLSETDPVVKGQMTRAWDLWNIQRLAELRRAPATRPEAHRKLVELATLPDEEVAMAALQTLPLIQTADAAILPALTALYQQTASVQRKGRILSILVQLDDPAILPLYQQGMADSAVDLRRVAFIELSNIQQRRKNPAIPPLLQGAAAVETDLQLKNRMEEILTSLPR